MHTLRIPGTQELRNFGLLMGAVISLVFGGVVPWLMGSTLPTWPWVVAATLVGLALLMPPALRPVYAAWMRIGYFLNWLVSRAALVLVYYGVVALMGTVMRMLKKDPMRRRLEPGAVTYRVTSETPDPKHLERPF